MEYQQKIYNTLLPSKAVVSVIVFLLMLGLISPIYSQVYNYSPINYKDIETNPAVTASESKNSQIDARHLNTFSASNKLSSSSIKVSKYFESAFSGLGLILNNTNTGDSIRYDYIGLAAGYRNVLFNKVYFKMGLTYKLIQTNAPSGNFDYYSFAPTGSNKQKKVNSSVNLALSLSTPSDRYFASLASLNTNVLWDKINSGAQFPSYYVFHLGNLMSLFDESSRNSEISYTAFSKYSLMNKKTVYSQYIDLKFVFNITRSSSLKYGSRAGYTENQFIHFIPFLTYFTRKSALTASYSFYLNKNNFQSKYPSAIQLSIIYNL